MSYNCYISFKKMQPNEVFDFLADFKKETLQNLHEIAQSICHCAPFTQDPNIEDRNLSEKEKLTIANGSLNQAWFHRVFHYRYFYDERFHLLGVFGVPFCMRRLFDGTYQFQDSCDQNYDYDYWHGVAEFDYIATQWKLKPRSDIAAKYKRRFGVKIYDGCNSKTESDENVEYYRKVFAYENIWNRYKKYLESDDFVIHFSPFGYSDFKVMRSFLNSACKSYLEVLANE